MKGAMREARGVFIGALLGALLSASGAFGYAMFNAWQGFGPDFQLGYVVGYFDGVTLANRHDIRGYMSWMKIPYEQWRDEVNKYYQDEARRKYPLPTAMHDVYVRLVAQKYPKLGEAWKRLKPVSPSPKPPTASASESPKPPAPGETPKAVD